MISFTYTLKDPMGLHARPAGALAKEVRQYKSKITITAKGQTVEVVRLIAVMRLGTKAGDKVTFSLEGEDEAAASAALQSFLERISC